MDKVISVWAIKLNNYVAELKVARGPIKILRSSMKKTSVSKLPRRDYSTIPPRTVWEDHKTVVNLKQTTVEGGRTIGMISPTMLAKFFPNVVFGRKDVVKLSEAEAKLALSPSWRRTNLR